MLREKATAGRYRAVAAAAAAASVFAFVSGAARGPVPSQPVPLAASEVQVTPPADAHVPQGTGLYAISCPRPGACTAGGNYETTGGAVAPMVAAQVRGRWQPGARLLLPANAARQPYAQVNGLSCSKPGTCVAVGNYTYFPQHDVGAFLAVETGGRWARAVLPRLPANAATPQRARLAAVACRPDGFCEAVGSYLDTAGHVQSLALAKAPAGPWGAATEIAAPAGAPAAPDAVMTGLSCTGPGACVAVGHYTVRPGASRGMGAVETGGRWQRAVGVPPPPGAAPSSYTGLTAISCTSHGTCLAVGTFALTSARDRAMSVTVSHGVFGKVTAVTVVPPGASVNPSTALSGVSCPAAGGPCAATGVATSKAGHYIAMEATVLRGRWSAAFLAGPPDVSTGRGQQSSLFSVSCTAPRRCVAVGYYNDASGGYSAGAASTR
jgi:hypothetical protein